MGIGDRYTQTRHRALSFLTIACTTDRDVEAPVQTTVKIPMLEVICTTGEELKTPLGHDARAGS
jgi:aspartate/glutamate racemase